MTATAKSQGPLFTKRALFTLIWPLLLEQTLSVTMGMADTLICNDYGIPRKYEPLPDCIRSKRTYGIGKRSTYPYSWCTFGCPERGNECQ